MAKQIVEEHEGRVPDDIETLLKFKGVGRKTANLVVTVMRRDNHGNPCLRKPMIMSANGSVVVHALDHTRKPDWALVALFRR